MEKKKRKSFENKPVGNSYVLTIQHIIKPRLGFSAKLSSLEFDVNRSDFDFDANFNSGIPLYWYIFNLISPMLNDVVLTDKKRRHELDTLIRKYSCYKLSDYIAKDNTLIVKPVGLTLTETFMEDKLNELIKEEELAFVEKQIKQLNFLQRRLKELHFNQTEYDNFKETVYSSVDEWDDETKRDLSDMTEQDFLRDYYESLNNDDVNKFLEKMKSVQTNEFKPNKAKLLNRINKDDFLQSVSIKIAESLRDDDLTIDNYDEYAKALNIVLGVENSRKYNISKSFIKFNRVDSDNMANEVVTEYQLPVMPGITLIVGKSGSGKSTLIDYISNSLRSNGIDAHRVYLGEPDSLSLTEAEVKTLLSFQTHQTITLIDSITNLLNATGDQTAGSGGISLELMDDLPILNSSLIKSNRSIALVLNTNEKSNVQELIQAFSGKVSTIISAEGQSGGRFNFIISTRFNDDRQVVTVEVPSEEVTQDTKKRERLNLASDNQAKEKPKRSYFEDVDTILDQFLQ